ncbi:hypothetical protein MLD59_02605 [Verrucomicrobiaceae bacterium E54]|nr:hypothetical protein [Verrucomicrobiaceae bacterium E54]
MHDWLFSTACQLVRMGVTDDQIAKLLTEWTTHVNRCIYDREVQDAVGNARRIVTGLDSERVGWKHRVQKPSWQEKLHALARAKRETGITSLDGLIASSPSAPPEATDDFIDALFPAESLICAGSEVWNCKVSPREELRGCWDSLRHIVPSPMSAETGINLQGEVSSRCLDNTGPRRFLVLESDELNFDDASAMLMWIGRRLPLVAVVYSGNKSLHGWYYVEGRDEDEIDRLRSEHELLWLDPNTFTVCHPVRTPGVVRKDTGRMQRCLWFADLEGERGSQ